MTCVVAGLVKMACFGFDSHALPPLTRQHYERILTALQSSPLFLPQATAIRARIALSFAAGDKCMYRWVVLRFA